MGLLVDIQLPVGLDLENDEANLYNGLSASASTVEFGVYAVDETVVLSSTLGGPHFTTMKAVATADLPAGYFGVAQRVITNGNIGLFRFSGVMKCRVKGEDGSGNAAISAGTLLAPSNGNNYLRKCASGASNTGKAVGKALESLGSGSTDNIWVHFMGICGVGHCVA